MAAFGLFSSKWHCARLLYNTTLSLFAFTGQSVRASLYLAAAPLMSPDEKRAFPSSFTTRAAACFNCRSSFGAAFSQFDFVRWAEILFNSFCVLEEVCMTLGGDECGMYPSNRTLVNSSLRCLCSPKLGSSAKSPNATAAVSNT